MPTASSIVHVFFAGVDSVSSTMESDLVVIEFWLGFFSPGVTGLSLGS